ncbi:MAG: MFS transporter, partial [Acidimicrobiales bacterium]|nr:MFS transporter [Acidimicrobiales bacterium]
TITIGVVAGITSQLVGRIGPRIPMTLGPIIGAIGLIWVSFINVNANYFDIIGPMMTVAAGMGLTFVPLTLTAVSKVELKEAGLASALLNTTQQIGGSLGLSILVTISIAASKAKVASMGFHASTSFNPSNLSQLPIKARMVAYQVITSGYVAAFKVASYIALAAVLIALVVIRIKKEDLASNKIEISG